MGRRDSGRVELSARQVRDIEKYIKTVRSESSTDEEASDAAGTMVGYVRSALDRQRDPERAE